MVTRYQSICNSAFLLTAPCVPPIIAFRLKRIIQLLPKENLHDNFRIQDNQNFLHKQHPVQTMHVDDVASSEELQICHIGVNDWLLTFGGSIHFRRWEKHEVLIRNECQKDIKRSRSIRIYNGVRIRELLRKLTQRVEINRNSVCSGEETLHAAMDHIQTRQISKRKTATFTYLHAVHAVPPAVSLFIYFGLGKKKYLWSLHPDQSQREEKIWGDIFR